MADDLTAPLGEFCRRHGLTGEVTSLRRLSGGASRETWSFDLGDRPLIMQRARRGALPIASAMAGEAGLLRAAAESGVPVATVVAATDDPEVLGAPAIVVDRLAGETIPRRLQRDDEFAMARRGLVVEAAGALAGIHGLDPLVASHLRADDQLAQLRGLADVLGDPHPAFELAFRWLAAERPEAVEPVVVHGDFRLGNLLVDADGLRAVLDWELSHLGDPIEDLGWFSLRAWTFGGPGEVAGLASVDELVDAYESAAGTSVDRDVLHWWRVLGTLRWGVICMLQVASHRSGATRSVELAAIGRRVCETEYDLLRLLP